jgi:hypothetical protein
VNLPSPYDFSPAPAPVSEEGARAARRAMANRSAVLAGVVGAWAAMSADGRPSPGILPMLLGFVAYVMVAMPRPLAGALLVIALAFADAALAPVHRSMVAFADVAFPLRPLIAAAAALALAAVVAPPRIPVVTGNAELARVPEMSMWRMLLVGLPGLGLMLIALFRSM